MKICLVLLLLLPWLSRAQPLLTVCYETDDVAPFISASGNSTQPKGILVDMLRLAASQLNMNLQFQQAPWLRCQKMVQENQLNATLAMIWSAQRAQQFRFPDEESGVQQSERYLWRAQYPVFSLIARPFSLQHYQPEFGIGAPLGYIIEDWLKSKGWLSPYKFTLNSGLQMVVDGKLDGYSVERFIGMHHLRQLQLDDKIAASSDNLLVEKWFLVFNQQYYQQNQQLVEAFWFNIGNARQVLEARFPYPDSASAP
ncbi:transporter substrate-binding domain-containing protein [Rheinheimera muenzenbergensis]|uniref:Transporter substrate-binding domain-containing protein n=1 Tax=Rheinheimera muenzenbergensis TaxID=1193628 RepID=A0ABU8C5Q3_9GAMM